MTTPTKTRTRLRASTHERTAHVNAQVRSWWSSLRRGPGAHKGPRVAGPALFDIEQVEGPPPAPAHLPIDPRIRDRRVVVQREAGRRRLAVLIAISTVLAIPVLGLAATHSAVLDVRHVRVRGAVHTSPEAIAYAAGLDGSRHMIDVDAA